MDATTDNFPGPLFYRIVLHGGIGGAKLPTVWSVFVHFGYQVRKGNLDGRAGWQLCKSFFKDRFTQEIIVINDQIKALVDQYYTSAGEDDKDSSFNCLGVQLKNDVETQHFFIQHFRIPRLGNYKLTLLQLFQIAYNVGQFKAECEKNSYDPRIISFYQQHKLDQLSAFVTSKDDFVPEP